MNATAGSRLADGRLVCGAVNVNVTRVRVHVAAAIAAGFEAFQPHDARGDFGIGKFGLRGVTDDFAGFENRAGPFAGADFFRDTMQAERRAIRAFDLPDAETRSGAGELP